MQPSILIIEPRREIAEALSAAIACADFTPLVRPHLERLSDLPTPPAAIVVRIAFDGISEPAHAVIGRLPPGRPPVVAIAGDETAASEARRLGCDVILRAPADVHRLCDVLSQLAGA